MDHATFAFSSDLLSLLRQPLSAADAQETVASFFDRPPLAALYCQAQQPGQAAPVMQACAALLPELPPQRAAMLALMGGTLVEDGADPTLMFPACLALLDRWLQQLQPCCAEEVDEDDDQAEPEAVQAWADAQAHLAAVPREQRWEVEMLHQAVELLVLPMMTMVLRDEGNHAAFVAHGELQARLAAMHANGSLPFEQLYYLVLAACISYEDELAVVLPASGTGFVARVHAANNGFHAFSMLQGLIRTHGQTLGVRADLLGSTAESTPGSDDDSALFQWLQGTAYAQGELVNEMAWAWGEAPLRSFAKRNGRSVLVALDREGGCHRHWSGFTSACHEAQNPHAVFKRYLTPEEVAALLQ